MAAEDGGTPQHLSYLQRASGFIERFGLFGLLRGAEARAPGLPRIGASRVPVRNIVDLAQVPILAFPGSTLESIEFKRGRAQINGYWLGLTGPMGPLPLHLTEFASYERRYSRQRPFNGFLDLLAGRMLQFFYRAWADSQPAVQAERPADDQFALYLAALSGAEEGAGPHSAFPGRARLHYAGLFASKRSPAGLQDALTNLLRTPVRLLEYQSRWRDVEDGDRSRLGKGFASLGGDAVLGTKVYGVADAFRIVIKARSMSEFEDFLPSGRRFKVAAEALDAFAPSHLEWDIALELPSSEARPLKLDGRGRLGWTAWLAPARHSGLRIDAHLGLSARRIAREETSGRKTDGMSHFGVETVE